MLFFISEFNIWKIFLHSNVLLLAKIRFQLTILVRHNLRIENWEWEFSPDHLVQNTLHIIP